METVALVKRLPKKDGGKACVHLDSKSTPDISLSTLTWVTQLTSSWLFARTSLNPSFTSTEGHRIGWLAKLLSQDGYHFWTSDTASQRVLRLRSGVVWYHEIMFENYPVDAIMTKICRSASYPTQDPVGDDPTATSLSPSLESLGFSRNS